MMVGITELSKSYAQKHGISIAEAKRTIKSVLDEVLDAVYDFGGVQIIDKFALGVKTIDAHGGTDPRTQEPIEIPKSVNLTAKAGKKFKEALSEKYL